MELLHYFECCGREKLFDNLGGFRNLPMWADYDCWKGLQQLTDSLYIDIPLFYFDGLHGYGRNYENNNPKVLFFYQSGRKERLSNKQEYAKEMFYGYHFFNDKNYKTDIVEFNSHKTIFGKYFF